MQRGASHQVPLRGRCLDRGCVGQAVKDPENPTEKEAKIIEQQQKLNEELENLIPDPLPELPQERQKLQKQVQKTIEKVTGKVTPAKISLGKDPKKVAEAIAKANADLDYLRDLAMELDLLVELMQPSLAA